jgi:hypothetical protein
MSFAGDSVTQDPNYRMARYCNNFVLCIHRVNHIASVKLVELQKNSLCVTSISIL